MSELRFYFGPMDCGKSTLALQMEHNLCRQNRKTLLLTSQDRLGASKVSSRIGLSKTAIEVMLETNLFELVKKETKISPVRALVCDESQFYSPLQIEELARVVDELGIDVFCYGIATDFTSHLFPGAKRLFELADQCILLQVETYCWCGKPGRQQARVVNDEVVRTGDQVVVGDTAGLESLDNEVVYQVLCRSHFFAGQLR